ncbi:MULTISPECIES: hypothetical protein [Stenotrophomonas]|jgi:hypothetical protein|uniref:hypothetical protein n=1 Tax=Stenotrophomonas TaxID=40323 RepID=UPI00201CB8C8|nr:MULTISPECIES: hypothetical protein [Stenotrophomonas]MDQ1064486.1 hypothetical protein [Stenotrophomonas sp. SORGH_AS_0282]MDQ1190879.1 hypothetical protein [Stenotrophomonas sp. SORGH_AS_0282]UQY87688.1 hypothetical protein LQE85_00145 [Stenotrophomonas rhizophila]
MKRNRLVSQQDEWGCGIACVASLTGLSYREARSRLEARKGGLIDADAPGLELEPIIDVLRDAGILMEQRVGAKRWPSGAIVFLSEEWGRYRGTGHYLLRTDDGWMDPWANPDEKRPRAEYLDRLPRGTTVQVALVPVED